MNPFYTVVRQFFKNGKETHSMEIKQDREEAILRYFSIISADLGDPDITYNAVYVIDSNGLMIEGRVFDRGFTAEEEAGNEA